MKPETKDLIIGERKYQQRNEPPTKHTVLEYLIYILDFTEEGLQIVSRLRAGDNMKIVKSCVRKVAALAVAGIADRDNAIDFIPNDDADDAGYSRWLKREERSLEYYLATIKILALQGIAREVHEIFVLQDGALLYPLEAIRDCACVCLDVHGAPPR